MALRRTVGNTPVNIIYPTGTGRVNEPVPEPPPLQREQTSEFPIDAFPRPSDGSEPRYVPPVDFVMAHAENIDGQIVRTIDTNSSGSPIWDNVNLVNAGSDLGDVDVSKVGQQIKANTNTYTDDALTQGVELGENLILNNPTITTTTAVVGGVAIVTLNYGALEVNIDGDYYSVDAGSIALNDLDVPAPTLYWVWVELVAGVPTVKKSTVSPHVPGVECLYAFVSSCLMSSIGGVATIYYLRRVYNSNYNQMHHIGDYDAVMEPSWVSGMGISINPASGNVSVAAGSALRLTRDLVFDVALNTTLLLDNETTVANLEAITTYSDGSPITPGRYHKLLVGAVVARAGSAYKVRVLRQDVPTVEYATLDEARIDAERRAQVSFGSSWRPDIIPIYYVYMLVGNASDLGVVDIRESGVTGGGGGGSVTVEKIVLVDNTGAGDFLTIADAIASVPNPRGMIISLMSGQVHDVASALDCRGITFKFGGGSGTPIIRAQAGGQLIVAGTTFQGLKIRVPIGFGTYFLDVQGGFLEFEGCYFEPGAGEIVIGRSLAPAVLTCNYQYCSQNIAGGYTGAMIDPAGPFILVNNIVIGTSDNEGQLQLGAYNVITDAEGRFDTTGPISGLPDNVLYVHPGENIQVRLDSLTAGGVIYLLPCAAGVYHDITNSLLITQNGTKIVGIGNAIIRAQVATWVGAVSPGGRAPAAIEVGAVDGAGPINISSISDVRFELEPAMCGIRVNGGMTHFVSNCDIVSTGSKAGGARYAGIEIIDSAAAAASDVILTSNILESDVHVNRWIDGINVCGLAPIGNGNGISGVAASGNYCADIDDCMLYCVGMDDSTLYVDGAWASGKNGGTGAIYMGTCNRVQVTEMSITTSNHANAPGIVLDNSSGNQIYGNAIFGNGTNFLNGVALQNNSDNNIISDNYFSQVTTGISIGAGCGQNKIGLNEYIATVTDMADATTSNYIVGKNMYGATNPGGVVTAHFGDCYYDGTHDVLYKCVSYPQGTTWRRI